MAAAASVPLGGASDPVATTRRHGCPDDRLPARPAARTTSSPEDPSAAEPLPHHRGWGGDGRAFRAEPLVAATVRRRAARLHGGRRGSRRWRRPGPRSRIVADLAGCPRGSAAACGRRARSQGLGEAAAGQRGGQAPSLPGAASGEPAPLAPRLRTRRRSDPGGAGAPAATAAAPPHRPPGPHSRRRPPPPASSRPRR